MVPQAGPSLAMLPLIQTSVSLTGQFVLMANSVQD